MRHDVETGAMAHGRTMQERIAGHDRINLGRVGMAGPVEHAVRQHRALGAPRGAGRVEQPGEIVSLSQGDRRGIGLEQFRIFRAADGDEAIEARRRVCCDLRVDARRGEANLGARMLQDVAELRAVQLGICGHSHKAGMPGGIEDVEIINGIVRGNPDALTRLEAKAGAQCAGKPRDAPGKLSVAAHHPRAQADGRQTGMAQPCALEPQRQIHCATPSRYPIASGDQRETNVPPQPVAICGQRMHRGDAS